MNRTKRFYMGTGVLIAVVSLLYLPKLFFAQSLLYTEVLTEHVLVPTASVIKLLSLLAGAIFAARVATRFERGGLSRRAWWLVSVCSAHSFSVKPSSVLTKG